MRQVIYCLLSAENVFFSEINGNIVLYIVMDRVARQSLLSQLTVVDTSVHEGLDLSLRSYENENKIYYNFFAPKPVYLFC